MIELYIINTSNNPLPTYQTKQAAGVDLMAFLEEPIVIEPMDRVLVGTGLYMALPNGYEAMIRPRSGMAFKHGITVNKHTRNHRCRLPWRTKNSVN